MKADFITAALRANPLTMKALSLVPSYHAYRKLYTFLQESQWWSREELEAYQMEALSRLLDHAYENVPYYRRVFRERGLVPEDIATLSDLELLPFLTKEIVQANLPDLKARNYPESAFEYVRTSGSTGTPMGFYYEKGASRVREWAFMKTQWDRIGYRFHRSLRHPPGPCGGDGLKRDLLEESTLWPVAGHVLPSHDRRDPPGLHRPDPEVPAPVHPGLPLSGRDPRSIHGGA